MKYSENYLIQNFPKNFWGLLAISFLTYKKNFFNYLLLGFLVYLPCLITIQFFSLEILVVVDFISTRFLDVVVFLTMPVWFLEKKVYPLGTLQIFFQKYFGPVVKITLIQLFFLFLLFFAGGLNPTFLLFPGLAFLFIFLTSLFFVLTFSDRPLPLRICFSNSILLVRMNFLAVLSKIFLLYFLINILTLISMALFAPQYIEDFKNLNEVSTEQQLMANEATMLKWFKENNMLMKFGLIQIILRPIASLFISYLFISLTVRTLTPQVFRFLFGVMIDSGVEPDLNNPDKKTTK